MRCQTLTVPNPNLAGQQRRAPICQQSPLLSALIQQSTFMARVGRGKNTFSEDYTTHHLLIGVSLSHPPLPLEMALTFFTLTPSCHHRFQQKRRVRQGGRTPRQGHEKTPPPHTAPRIPRSCHETRPRPNEFNFEHTANRRAPEIYYYSLPGTSLLP